MRRWLAMLLLVALVLSGPGTARAGKLDNFEKGTDNSGGGSGGGGSGHSHGSGGSDGGLAEEFAEFLFELLVKMAAYTVYESAKATHKHYLEREDGSRELPKIRIDTGYQYVFGGIHGLNTRAEVGYSFVGASFDFTRYWEPGPKDALNQYSGALLFRVAPNNRFRLDTSLGGRTLSGNGTHSAFELGLLMGIYPVKHWGMETDARWSYFAHTLQDYRIGLVYKRPFWDVRAGYRVQRLALETLHGPEISAGFIW